MKGRIENLTDHSVGHLQGVNELFTTIKVNNKQEVDKVKKLD